MRVSAVEASGADGLRSCFKDGAQAPWIARYRLTRSLSGARVRWRERGGNLDGLLRADNTSLKLGRVSRYDRCTETEPLQGLYLDRSGRGIDRSRRPPPGGRRRSKRGGVPAHA